MMSSWISGGRAEDNRDDEALAAGAPGEIADAPLRAANVDAGAAGLERDASELTEAVEDHLSDLARDRAGVRRSARRARNPRIVR